MIFTWQKGEIKSILTFTNQPNPIIINYKLISIKLYTVIIQIMQRDDTSVTILNGDGYMIEFGGENFYSLFEKYLKNFRTNIIL